jgi:hypothetical protein
VHSYYPDFVITLKSGKTVIAEVGEKKEKESSKALAKAVGAIDYCNERGWEYWLITSDRIMSDTYKDNLITLKSYDKPMYKIDEVQRQIIPLITGPLSLSIENIVDSISGRFHKKGANAHRFAM